jgi:pilus assembly protein CpaB
MAVLGALLVFAYGRSLRGQVSAGPAVGASGAPAFVASTAIPAGTPWQAVSSTVKPTSVPAAARPADAVSSFTQLSGLTSVRRIEVGEVVTTAQFGASASPSAGGLPLPPGMNAITIEVPFIESVAGYVSAGDKVNVYVNSKEAGNATQLLVSNVLVLATVPAAGKAAAAAPAASATPAAGGTSYTLALTPSDTEKVIFAKTYEVMWFGLVHAGDAAAVTPGRNFPTLFK